MVVDGRFAPCRQRSKRGETGVHRLAGSEARVASQQGARRAGEVAV